MIRRVCLLGGESSGKTTLARALGRALQEPVVEEYGRDLWIERAGHLTFEDYLHIAERHVRLEEDAQRDARCWVIVDTSPLTTLFYCLDQFGRADPALQALAKRRYDQVLLCLPDFPFVQDGFRRDAPFRQAQYDWYVRELTRDGVAHTPITGNLQAREERALALLS